MQRETLMTILGVEGDFSIGDDQPIMVRHGKIVDVDRTTCDIAVSDIFGPRTITLRHSNILRFAVN